MIPGKNKRLRLTLLTCVGLAIVTQAIGQGEDSETELTDLDDFIIYANPDVRDALRRRPFSQKNAVVEAFFHALPSINNEIYQTNLTTMRRYLERAIADKDRKLSRLSRLAGLSETPVGLIEGYDERIDTLQTLLEWLERDKPIHLKRIDVWKERDIRYRLARRPLENIRINPETNAIESRLYFNWRLIFQNREKARNLRLDFDMGIHLQDQTGYYNPQGFLHLKELRRRDFNPVEVTYPVIITQELEDNMDAVLPRYLSAYRTTMNSFYHILREYFFSDLADVHALYILTRGEIFADEWGQYQSTALQRGLAAYVVFKAFEEYLGPSAVKELQKNDWTTWHIRKIGTEYNPITWSGENPPTFAYGEYKQTPNLRNIYWSTLFVQFLADRYGDRFVFDMCKAIQSSSGGSINTDDAIFKLLTGDDLEPAILEFIDGKSIP